MSINLNDSLKFANSFADVSGEILNRKFLKPFNLEQKFDGSYVTDIDKEIESKFREMLKKKFPSNGVVGEEFEDEGVHNEYVWVIDPLDGTHNFIAGKPLFGTLISCLKNNKPILGIIDIPILKKRWYGGQGIGVFLNKSQCPVYSKKKKFRNRYQS